MATFNVKTVAELKEVFSKSEYVIKEWRTDDALTMTLSQYAELINPVFKRVSGNPTIIAKERKDGNIFLKMLIPLEGAPGAEFDLSYKSDWDEGDEIDKDTLCFCVEKFMDKKHGYATGELAE